MFGTLGLSAVHQRRNGYLSPVATVDTAGDTTTKHDLAMQLDRRDFESEMSLLRLEKQQRESRSAGLSIEDPVSVLLVVIRAGSDCCKWHLHATEGDEEEEEETATASQ